MNIKEQLEKFNQAPKIGEFDGCDNERDSHNKINQVPEKEETPALLGWVCSRCGRVYSSYTSMCVACSNNDVFYKINAMDKCSVQSNTAWENFWKGYMGLKTDKI